MENHIGILVDQRALKRALRDRPTYERISLYREIALSEGFNIIVFSVEAINVKRNRVSGFVPTPSGWERCKATIPKIIHKRVLFKTSDPLKTLGRLKRRNVVFVNPYRMQNKLKMNALLAQNELLKPHIPPTHSYRWPSLYHQLKLGNSVILKPRVGSVGQGICKIVPISAYRAQITGMGTRTLSFRSLQKRLRGLVSPKHYLMQDYLSLAQYNGRPFDLRVPVQRDEKGDWVIPGMVAKVAQKHPYLTNLAQGGRAIPGETAIFSAFSKDRSVAICKGIQTLAFSVAQTVAGRYPYAADLGLDIGIDVEGKPWLIEVNTRDQRITFHEAGMQDAFRTLYKNPLAFCTYLTKTRGF